MIFDTNVWTPAFILDKLLPVRTKKFLEKLSVDAYDAASIDDAIDKCITPILQRVETFTTEQWIRAAKRQSPDALQSMKQSTACELRVYEAASPACLGYLLKRLSLHDAMKLGITPFLERVKSVFPETLAFAATQDHARSLEALWNKSPHTDPDLHRKASPACKHWLENKWWSSSLIECVKQNDVSAVAWFHGRNPFSFIDYSLLGEAAKLDTTTMLEFLWDKCPRRDPELHQKASPACKKWLENKWWNTWLENRWRSNPIIDWVRQDELSAVKWYHIQQYDPAVFTKELLVAAAKLDTTTMLEFLWDKCPKPLNLGEIASPACKKWLGKEWDMGTFC
jgi:hypothetical protein